MTRPRATRARLALAAVLLAVVAGVAVAVAAISGPSEPPPATGAAAVVPADALAYVHLSTDGSRPAVKRALALAAHFPDLPLLAERLASRLRVIAPGGALSFAAGVRPWLGKEAAIALLNTTASTAATLVVLDVAHTAEAHAFLARAGIARAGAYRGVVLFGAPTGTELAFVSHYLVVGQDASVRAAIDVTNGRAPSLAANQAYQRAAATEPYGRVLDAYASAVGVRRLLIDRGGLLGGSACCCTTPRCRESRCRWTRHRPGPSSRSTPCWTRGSCRSARALPPPRSRRRSPAICRPPRRSRSTSPISRGSRRACSTPAPPPASPEGSGRCCRGSAPRSARRA